MKVFYDNSGVCASHLRDWMIIKNSIPNFVQVNHPFDADIIIVYLCAISSDAMSDTQIEKAMKLVDSIIDKFMNFRKVFVGGCIADIEGNAEKLKTKYPFITDTFGKANMAEKVLAGLNLAASDKPALYVQDSTASITISTGCFRRCSFCKTWYLSNMRYHSTPKEVVMKEIETAVFQDVLHICITGENTTEYGMDLDGKMHLLELLKEIIDKFPQIKILDVMGVTLDEVDKNLLRFLIKEPRINMVQMEVQSFIQEVRELMGLRKTANEAKGIFNQLRASKVVSSNIIIGHPGETDANFATQLNYLETKWINTWSMDISPLDATEGTPVYNMERCSSSVVQKRLRAFLNSLCRMRENWANVYLRGKTVRAYVHNYFADGDATSLCMWGQPVQIIVKGQLPLYKTYDVHIDEIEELFSTSNMIRCKGHI